ncbi:MULTISPECIES: hypothetical protein [unclassified Novosphingobium]|uniref:hypothetical protein n=1 Tax=unclassified Novosphingobium TaxID=2644732 RepID=UPI00146CD9E7|nr:MULTISPECIES: hypothetical protein [unclassified Novosphingobium]NMN07200.1 hypothetical protein [Novosphingobium sp. SG919]NMN89212.1 hypothetical protein [Novosphingobium sp. SG916]
MAQLIDICNRALAQIAAGQIADFAEGSIEAREATRFAKPLLAELAEWAPWPWARTRVVLAEVSNDRPAEWLHAYAAPTNLAQPIAVRAVEDDATTLPSGGPFPFPLQDAAPLAFLYEGGRIYANVANATLVFVRNNVTAPDLPPLVARAFELELAARLALPVKKDATAAQTLARAAEIARMRAIADEANKSGERPARYVSEAELARAGLAFPGDAA